MIRKQEHVGKFSEVEEIGKTLERDGVENLEPEVPFSSPRTERNDLSKYISQHSEGSQ